MIMLLLLSLLSEISKCCVSWMSIDSMESVRVSVSE